MCPAPVLFLCARIPVSIQPQSGLPFGSGEKKGLNGDSAVRQRWLCTESCPRCQHTSSVCYIARSLRIFHPTKNLRWFLPDVFPALLLGRGSLHSQGDAPPVSAGFLLSLPQVSGGGACWLHTSGEGVSSASFPCARDFARESALRFRGCRGFPCPAREFPCEVVRGSAFERRVGKKKTPQNISCSLPAPQNALEGLHLQAASFVPSSAPLRRFRHPGAGESRFELSACSSPGWGHPFPPKGTGAAGGWEPCAGTASLPPAANHGWERGSGSAPGAPAPELTGLATSSAFLAIEGPGASVRRDGPAHTFGSTLP